MKNRHTRRNVSASASGAPVQLSDDRETVLLPHAGNILRCPQVWAGVVRQSEIPIALHLKYRVPLPSASTC